MDDLRSEIRAAFERQQAGHAPGATMRREVVEAVTARSRPSRNFQWVAVVAAVLLGIAVVAGLMSTRIAHRASVPAATPNASPIAEYGPPPAGVNLLFARDPEHPSSLIGYDWSGNPRGTIKLDPAVGSVGMAPDGQAFAVGFGAKGGSGEILDRLGQPVPGSGAVPGSALPMWADDNRHMCGVSSNPQTPQSTLITAGPGEALKSVPIAAAGLRLTSCSFRNDRAIIVRTNTAWPAELYVVRISDGKIISQNTYAEPGLLSNVVGSADATLIAENSSKSTSQLGPTAQNTIIRRVSDRSVVATLDPSMGALAFNSDNSLVLVTTTPWVGGQATGLAVIDLRSGQAIWNYTGPEMFGNAVAQPGGRDFAIYVRNPTVEESQTDLTIVHADGTAYDFPGRYVPAW